MVGSEWLIPVKDNLSQVKAPLGKRIVADLDLPLFRLNVYISIGKKLFVVMVIVTWIVLYSHLLYGHPLTHSYPLCLNSQDPVTASIKGKKALR